MSASATFAPNRPAWTVPSSALEAVLARIRALSQRRLLWLEHLAANEKGETGNATSLRTALFDLDDPDEERRFLEKNAHACELWDAAERHNAWLFETDSNRLRHLAESLNLEPSECDLLQVCMASSIDPGLAEVYGVLAGVIGRTAPTEALAARLCGHGRNAVWSPGGALSQWQIIEVEDGEAGTPAALRVDPYVLSYLRGGNDIDADLHSVCTMQDTSLTPLTIWPVEGMAARIAESLEQGVACRVQIIGPPMSGRKTLAGCIAADLQCPLMVVDTARVDPARWSHVRVRAQRQAIMHGCAIAWQGQDARKGLDHEKGLLPLEFAIVETTDDLAPSLGYHEERLTMPVLSSADRRELWLRLLPTARTWPQDQIRLLSERFAVTIGDIAHVALQSGHTFEDVCRNTRALSSGRLGDLAKLIDCPFDRSDLQIPAQLGQLLDEFLFEARDRSSFWEDAGRRRLFPRGTGLIGLLAGPPGTGKTMAAQVIAAELGLDLFRIDLASTVNKYIGETAKNLRRLFARASEMNAVLLFDEADSLFSKRTDVKDSHDRYANADTNYLLQLVEDYPGIALLATNKRQHMDEAFVRRVRYVFYFPRPDADQRLAIWRQLVDELAAPGSFQRLSDDLTKLAHHNPLTGAQIKNAVLAAVFLARQSRRPLEFGDIERGLDRQMASQSVPTTGNRMGGGA